VKEKSPLPVLRLLIVDDHPIVRRGLVRYLSRALKLEAVAEAETEAQALEVLQQQPIDFVIADLSLPGPSGLDLIKQIKAAHPDMPVLVLSMYDEAFYAERVLRAGAAGYVMKQEAIEEVLQAIRKVLAGDIYISPRMASRMLHRFVRGGRDASSSIAQLSDRELEVYHLIGQGYGTREIAGVLELSIKTVESYRANIKEKLGIENANELIQHAAQWVQTIKSI
jgi:DNA-binding NarL/FixJ family response regulator